jgi:hypothetical protein
LPSSAFWYEIAFCHRQRREGSSFSSSPE